MAHIVCLSDIHFGEPYSLLWRPDLPLYAGKMVGYLTGGSIDKLILVGDVWELAAPEEPDAAFPIARAFHHGHYFDDLILGKSGLDEFKARFTSLISGGWAKPNNPLLATDAADLEARCAPFIDAVWGRTTDRQTLKTQAWEFLTRFRKWSSCNAKGSADVPQFVALGN